MKEIEKKLTSYKSLTPEGVEEFVYTKDNNMFRITYKVNGVRCVDFVEFKDDWVDDFNALTLKIDNLLSQTAKGV